MFCEVIFYFLGTENLLWIYFECLMHWITEIYTQKAQNTWITNYYELVEQIWWVSNRNYVIMALSNFVSFLSAGINNAWINFAF